MTAEIITIGDELLIGQVVDSNAAAIAEQLHRCGIDVKRIETVPDDRSAIVAVLHEATRRSELTVVTGGLGPTHDDVTRDAVAQAFGTGLEVVRHELDRVGRRYKERGREVPASARIQATIPIGFTALPNAVGTAPGFWKLWEEGAGKRMLAVLPGVPDEMRVMLADEVMPRLREHRDLFQVRSRVLLTTGIPESSLQDLIQDLVPPDGASTRLAYLPSARGVRLRITGAGDDSEQIEADLDQFEARLRERLGVLIYGTGDDSLEAAVGRLMRDRKLTLAVAESCTGGLVAHRISDISGSSTYFVGALVAYSNAVKVGSLGVDARLLEREGAVSRIVALEMARGVRERMGAEIGVSTTGIAGPTGGTPDKPVGTVWIAYAGPDGEEAVLLHLVKQRRLNKELTATALLDLVRRRLLRMASEKVRGD